MLTDRELQALFNDSSDGESPKKKEKKPAPKGKSKKSRPPQRKTKINFDPNIFLDGVNEETDDAIESLGIKSRTDDLGISPTKNHVDSICPEFSSLISRVNFYLNSQLRYLMDDFTNELILLVDTTPIENQMIEDFLSDVLEAIQSSIIFADGSSVISATNSFTPNFFDMYAEYFQQSFIDAELFTKNTFETSQIKSLRKDLSGLYNNFKRNITSFPENLQTEIMNLSLAHSNYQSVLYSCDTQEKSQKKREIFLQCKKIEQDITSEVLSRKLQYIKDEKSRFDQFREIDELNLAISADHVNDMIYTTKKSLEKTRQKPKDFCAERIKTLKKMRKELKIMRDKFNVQQQNAFTIGASELTMLDQNYTLHHSSNQFSNNSTDNTFNFTQFTRSNPNMLSPNQTYSTHDSSKLAENINQNKKRSNNYKKIQQSFQSMLEDQKKELMNTTAFLESVQDGNRTNMMKRLRKSMYNV
ncbi:hypothetical protein TRFO_14302 [Tritrichomonas foetus]|uniref:Uncharacterized protein n=1 Tax=Tritrichomonas foetus TaxID=1144522 RepID=A0A1J4KVB4_9EUKA|nr:hypothetical protein TRFO_14302 [Tritrichomonas foetus]|eukprot:OHT15257.1 hypothetical protein TRFO_14302 [Tritrichomonas foetus]